MAGLNREGGHEVRTAYWPRAARTTLQGWHREHDGLRCFALVLAGLLFHFVFRAFDLHSFSLNVESQAVEDRDVLVRDPDQGEEAEQRSAPVVINQTKLSDQ